MVEAGQVAISRAKYLASLLRLETLKLHMTGNNDATIQDGILLTVSLLEEMSERNEKIFQGNLEAQMLADEYRETVERLKGFATGISYPKNA